MIAPAPQARGAMCLGSAVALAARPPARPRRPGLTLFELVLAIALSATLLVLIGTAINLYLLRVDASRTRVEEAQLARGILAMVADDVRAAFVFQQQDTSTVASLAESAAAFDVDSIDQASAPSATVSASVTSDVLPLGVRGTLGELVVDISRLPRLDELYVPAGGAAATATTALSGNSPPPRATDVKTVRYFVRQGEQIAASSLAATSLAPESQLRASGLVRQELDRAARTWAEESGDQAYLDTTGLALVAPEVAYVEFRFFDGTEVFDYWDMDEMGSLPRAIEVRIWIASTDTNAAQDAMRYGLTSLAGTRRYNQTVYLPLSALASEADSSSTSASTSSTGEAAP